MKPSLRHFIPTGVFAAALAAGTLALYAEPQADTGPKGVVELFTSQGCSSCPPADRLVSAMARNPGLIAVSFPVDYWDYIGWKDTLASPHFTARQKAYASVRGDGHVYTPQIVVDGRSDVVGSDEDGVKEAIDANKGSGGALTVPMRLKDAAGTLHIELGAGTGDLARTSAGVFILRVAHTRTVTIERGENKGRSITYTNVVRAMRKIGEWHGEAASFDVTELKAEDEGYVVFLQQGTLEQPGTILAAAKSTGL
ncbi:DUF1223 domain-containing protein [Methyloferula stellata]|uniref:DUF1223 domain-containing protein n=1 Tax=Methyloferula stellata TaxID=876270 RepID=UPI00038144B2|nr:DUF1223 domain-containing protein [Methyloferula stellata]